MTRADNTLTVCVIGAGPHGLSVRERIRADAGAPALGVPVEVHCLRKAMHGHENGSRGEAVVRGRENYGATL